MALPAIAAAACQITPKDRLQGRWVGVRAENFEPAHVARVTGWVAGASFEFRGSRVVVTVPAESAREGTFSVIAARGGELDLRFSRPQGTTDAVEIELAGHDLLRWKLGGGRSILFRKAGN
ncbi:MAG: hypothetical protein HY744_28455 [Deltaproteobacteria bacterium]|nr:hypothetical protein [Deltaproteobacteria bacterium]